jgi:hypothetical protein
MIVTTPVTYMLLVRAALHRDEAEGRSASPAGRPGEDATGSADKRS